MGSTTGDEAAPSALETGSGLRTRDACVQGLDTLAEPWAQFGQRRVGVDLVLEEGAVQQVCVHEPHCPPGEPIGVPQESEAGVHRPERVAGVGLGAAEAQQAHLGAAVGVLDRESSRADEPNTELWDMRLPLVYFLDIYGAHGTISEQLQIPPRRHLVDAPFFGYETGQRRERCR
jgi:hypothetical protein